MSMPFHGRAGALAGPRAPPASLPMSSLLTPMACLPVLALGLSLESGQPCFLVPPWGAVAEALEGSPGWGWERGGQTMVSVGSSP